MLLSEEVEIKWNSKNKQWYESKSYIFTKINDIFRVKIKDLSKCSSAIVEIKCDCEDCKNTSYLRFITWKDYQKHVQYNGKYYCKKCLRLYKDNNNKTSKSKNNVKPKSKNIVELKTKNIKKSFEQWCIENNHQDVLNRWDYYLNNCKPNEVTYSTNNKYYFKCPRGLHKSELKKIQSFAQGEKGSMNCKMCNSFAQWGIDNVCENFLEEYWDYELNIIDPWKMSKGDIKKIYIKCQEKNYHGSYDIISRNFSGKRCRCPYCSNRHGRVHILDSLGTLYPQVLNIWSDKNKKTPYEYSPFSTQKIYWKCPEGIHDDHYRDINRSNRVNFRCPECEYSKGEERISNWLINNEFNKLVEEQFNILNDLEKKKYKYYIPQKEYDGLVGLSKGNLSYDFYLPNYNLLIEYQGEQHEKYISYFYKSKKDFEKQLEHDLRKREYAQNYNIKLLEIWYFNYDNIETILEKELRLA